MRSSAHVEGLMCEVGLGTDLHIQVFKQPLVQIFCPSDEKL